MSLFFTLLVCWCEVNDVTHGWYKNLLFKLNKNVNQYWSKQIHTFIWINDKNECIVGIFCYSFDHFFKFLKFIHEQKIGINIIYKNGHLHSDRPFRLYWRDCINESLTICNLLPEDNKKNYENLCLLIKDNSRIMYSLMKKIFNRQDIVLRDITVYKHIFDNKLCELIQTSGNQFKKIIKKEKNNYIGNSVVKYNDFNLTNIKNHHKNFYISLGLLTNQQQMNKQCLAQYAYLRYQEWMNTEISTCFDIISDAFTEIINILLIDKINLFSSLTDIGDYNFMLILKS